MQPHSHAAGAGAYNKHPLNAKLLRFQAENSDILIQDDKTKILCHVFCLYSKRLAKITFLLLPRDYEGTGVLPKQCKEKMKHYHSENVSCIRYDPCMLYLLS